MLGKLIDNLASAVSPSWYAHRLEYRQHASRLQAAAGVHESMRKMMSGKQGGYEAGKQDRLKGRTSGSAHENDLPRHQINTLRWRAWNLFRNCPQARKMSRSLGAKVIGKGLSPQPQATTDNGAPHVAFRKRAREVWSEFIKECDYRGKPGAGGQHFTALSKTTLRAAILSGGTLFRFHHLSRQEQARHGLFLPLQVQLVHVDRLDEQKHGGKYFYGLELDDNSRVAAYHITQGRRNATDSIRPDSVRVPATQMRHLYSEDDIDQMVGAPWVGAALLTMDDRRSYEYSELVAAEMASCYVAGYRRSAGKVGGIGLQQGGDHDLTDANGNPVTNISPGLFVDLGQSGELQMINPSRPNSNAEGFLNHLVRSEAVSMPGIKSSTLTGDYRQSSFSSERSADNDTWPEIEELQEWFSIGFCQPVYEECINAAVIAGKFDNVAGFSAKDYASRRRDYLNTNWQGPVARSINPKDDAMSSQLRVQSSTSSPQREAAQVGRDWREILQEIDEYIDYCQELDLPDSVWQQALGIEKASPVEPPKDSPSEEELDEQQRQADAAARLQDLSFYQPLMNSTP